MAEPLTSENTSQLPETPPVQEELPAGHINVLNPEGQLGHVPIDWLLSEGIKKGYKLPTDQSAAFSPEDITPDKQIKVVRKEDGMPGMVPADWFLSDPNAKNYEIASKFDATHQQKVNQDLVDLGEKHLFQDVEESELSKRHANDDVQDKEGNFKLFAPDGSKIAVPPKLVPALLGSKSGFKFQDENAQALFEAYQKRDQADKGDFMSFMTGTAYSLPGAQTLLEKAYFRPDANILHKMDLLNQEIKNPESSAYTAGQIAGTAAQLTSAKGLFGEVKLAQGAKAGLLARLAPEGASLGRQILARGLAGGLEGAIITAPQTIAQLAIDDNPQGAAESIGLGVGIGMFLGAGGKILSTAIEKGAEKGTALLKPIAATNILEQSGIKGEALSKVPEEVQQSFVQTLLDKGLTGKSKTEDVVKTIQEVAQGEKLIPTLQKLDKIAEPLAAGQIAAKLNDVGAELIKLDTKLTTTVETLNEKLTKFTDQSGNISLENLQKYLSEVGSEINWKKLDDPNNLARSQIWKVGVDELMQAADKAIAEGEPDAKLAATWANDKSVSQISQQIYDGLLKEPQETLNPIIKGLTKILPNKLTGLVAGGAIGGAASLGLGHGVGALIGSKIGEFAESKLQPLVEKGETGLIERYANSDTKLGNWLVRNKTSGAIGSYLALDSIKVMAHNLGQIPPFIKGIGNVAEKTPSMFIGHKDPIKIILGSEANGLSKQQQFQRLSDRAAEMSSSPTRAQQIFQMQIAPILKDHPELASQLNSDYEKKIQAINKILNENNKKEPQAFAKNKPYQPTPAQMKEIENQLKVVVNPYALLDGLKNGQISSKQVQIVQQLNPAILQKMREEIAKEAYSGKTTLNQQQRISASILMGSPMDPSLKNGQALQATYGGNAQQQQAQPSKKVKSQGNSKSLKADKIASYSLAQRISK